MTLSSLTYTITNPTLAGFTTITGTVDVSNSQAIGFSLALQASDGYSISLSATDSNGDSCAGGPASFSIVGGTSTTVGLTLVCNGAGDSGLIGPDVNPGTVVIAVDASLTQSAPPTDCAAVSSVVAAPNRIDVGHSISLSATGIDPDYQSSDVTLTWASTGTAGSLSGTSGTSNIFSCTAPGSETVTVTAAISGGGASCPGIGSVAIVLECDATSATADAGNDSSSVVVDAGADTGSTVDAESDAGSPVDAEIDTGIVIDAGADTGSPVEAGPDSSVVDAGPLVPCTAAGQANCVSCSGSTGQVCTTTEALFVQLDINASVATTAGPDPSGGCYACLLSNSCIDSPQRHHLGNECDDLSGNFTNGAGASLSAVTTCESVLQCVTSSPSPGCATNANGQSYCYCGTNGGPATSCGGASNQNGPCVTQELAGFTSSTPGTIILNYTDTTEPSGLANTLIGCAVQNNCTSCINQ